MVTVDRYDPAVGRGRVAMENERASREVVDRPVRREVVACRLVVRESSGALRGDEPTLISGR
jgi:hypothetical protein